MAEPQILLVPGGGNSGPDHWHSHWEAEDENAVRVQQADWFAGTTDDWAAAIDRNVRRSSAPVVLAAHSLGVIAAVHWARAYRGDVLGALLVAPADVEADWAPEGSLYRAFAPIPMVRLPFPSIVVASTDDPYLSVDRAYALAGAWGARLEIAGPLGHVGSDAGLGNWPRGRALLKQLVR